MTDKPEDPKVIRYPKPSRLRKWPDIDPIGLDDDSCNLDEMAAEQEQDHETGGTS